MSDRDYGNVCEFTGDIVKKYDNRNYIKIVLKVPGDERDAVFPVSFFDELGDQIADAAGEGDKIWVEATAGSYYSEDSGTYVTVLNATDFEYLGEGSGDTRPERGDRGNGRGRGGRGSGGGRGRGGNGGGRGRGGGGGNGRGRGRGNGGRGNGGGGRGRGNGGNGRGRDDYGDRDDY